MHSFSLQSGTLLGGRYEIDRLAGSGGMSSVYRARDRHTNQWVAVKILQTSSPASQETGRFIREAHVLAELRHPGIVGYVEHGLTPEGQSFLAMEWLDGEDLARRLLRGPLTVGESLLLVQQIATALQVAHQRGIVHRDLKPSNLFLRDGEIGRVTLLDFGIARHTLALRPMTQTGVVVGTPEYMAPEQARGHRDIGASADVFSLGCVLYECLIGQPPFVGEHVAAVLARILFAEARAVTLLRPAVPPELDGLLSRMLAKDQAQRLRDAGALLEALHTIPVEQSGLPYHPTAPAPTGLTGDELKLVSVVVATESGLVEAEQATLNPGDFERSGPQREQLDLGLADFRAQIEWLADGSLCATLSRPGSAMDQVAQAARLALAVHERWPTAVVGLATGRGLFHERLPLGEAIDRAVHLLRQHERGQTSAPGIWLDPLSKDLLGVRFEVVDSDGASLLIGEKDESDETRLLLGKPTPCLGREQELAMLEGILSSVIDDGAARAVLIMAPPGLGKSRLRHEFLRRLSVRGDDITVLQGRGNPMSAGSPYGLLAQALRRRFELPTRPANSEDQRQALRKRVADVMSDRVADAERVSEFLGELIGVPFPDENSVKLRAARNDPKVMSDQVSRAFVDYLYAETAQRPVLLVLEDLHWGDPLTVKLIDTVLRQSEGRPFMVLALARPEAANLFPRMWSGRVQELSLRALGKRACERLAQQILGPKVPDLTIARIAARSDGNALYLEELIRAVASGKQDELPETVLAMLQTRLHSLEPGERRVLRAASVFGETFPRGGIKALHSLRLTQAEMDTWLARLIEGELIERLRESRFAGEPEYRFRHALLRDAAYSLLTDEDRRTGHRLAASYLADSGESDPMVIAKHFRLGDEDARAIPYYVRAAEQALAGNNLVETLFRVEQGIDCGAQGEALGTLQGIACTAHFWRDDFTAAYPLGTSALSLLPAGGLRYIQTLGTMFTVTSLTGKMEHFGALVGAFGTTQPAPEARGAFVEAASLLVSMFSFGGAREPARAFLGLMQSAGAPIFDKDPLARGWLKQGHAIYLLMLESELLTTCAVAEEGLLAASAASARRMHVLISGFLGMARGILGDHAAAESILRDNLALAYRLGEPMAVTHAKVWMAMVLSARHEPALLAEAHQLAQDTLATPGANVFYLGSAQHVVARYHFAHGELFQAEAAARQAGLTLQLLPILRGYALSTHLHILLAMQRKGEARILCGDGEALLEQLGSASYAELPLRMGLTETYLATGDTAAARASLQKARAALDERANRIVDAAIKERFLTTLPDHIRLVELEQKLS
jgi:hypothetical protein